MRVKEDRCKLALNLKFRKIRRKGKRIKILTKKKEKEMESENSKK